MENPETMEGLALQVKVALESADLSAYAELLDPDVRWGPPGDPSPPCQNRGQVMAWYQRGKAAGTRASVTEVTVIGDRLLVGLLVMGAKDPGPRSRQSSRWQLLSVRDGRINDIVGFESREEAEAYVEPADSTG
ncbi:MAG TPA: nuclear transport factor 2 family protein [Acidimicrobiales bacterium]|jgi:hypothetical protein|nr:nuclear transport factor 2 family protein [Acidimicrobiales bacterium]